VAIEIPQEVRRETMTIGRRLTNSLHGPRLYLAVGLSLVLFLLASPALGHAVFMTYIRHDAGITIGARNIDITLQLTFFELQSLGERRRMDGDGNRILTSHEIQAYLKENAPGFASGAVLAVDGRPLDLIPLYEPELSLEGGDAVVPAHHVVKLYYFCRTPADLSPGSTLVLEDRLWTGAPALSSLKTLADDGRELVAVVDADPVSNPSGMDGPVRFVARLARPPVSPSNNGGTSGIVSSGTAGQIGPDPPARGQRAGRQPSESITPDSPAGVAPAVNEGAASARATIALVILLTAFAAGIIGIAAVCCRRLRQQEVAT
jgi:hypothetical protein